MIRQPIVSVLGHIDHGKTSLLDRIRSSTVVDKEAGGITQHIGATEVPIDVVKKICGPLLLQAGVEVTIPGLLFIDTPGHAAFTNLRKRGGSISDIGVLIVDINEGFKPQTYEALKILKSYKTPFIVLANKIDLFHGWRSNPKIPLLKSFKSQSEDVQQRVDTKIYEIVEILHKNEFSSERFDRVGDFTKQVGIIPISAKTGEGIPEFLMVLTGLTQKYMGEQLKVDVSGPGKGSVLEVKQMEGLGATLDVILYDGTLKKGDTIVVGTTGEPIVTKIKALLRPNPLQEIRIGSQFKSVDEAAAAAGIKISAPGIENALPGSPVMVASAAELENVKDEVRSQIEEVQIHTDDNGVIVKADTIGSLEALVKMLQDDGIVVRKASFGDVSRKDVMEAESVRNENELDAVIFAFNVKLLPDAKAEAEKLRLRIFEGDVVYGLIEEFKQWKQDQMDKTKEELLSELTMPGKIKLMEGCVFRQCNPAICGFEVLAGSIKPKQELMTKTGEVIGTIKALQKDNKAIEEAKLGEQVAVSIVGPTIGRHIKEKDILYVHVPKRDIKLIKEKLFESLGPGILELLNEIEDIIKKR
ncbi:MAG: translation initiation factor IF-2 [archaeon]